MALNSWQFIALAAGAALVLPLAPVRVRGLAFLTLNALFAGTYWGLTAAALAVGFCLAGYACARLVQRRGGGAVVLSLGLLTAAFVYVRGYSLDGLTNTSARATAGVLAFAGLSFLFFKVVHVVVDAAAGTLGPLSFWRFLSYCTNFTTVLMGPIQRYQDFAAQWNDPAYGQASFEQKVDAMNRVLRGMVKAFAMAPWVQPFVIHPGLPIESLGGAELLLRTYAFYVFLYLDFSGYCDVMIGVGSLIGLKPPENFLFPFLARNVSAYWLRVHRTLTQWLTDYVFTPSYRAALSAPGAGRHGFLALAASLVLTMLIAGVWHGTTLNFVIFGLVHGLGLVVVRGYELAMIRWLGRSGFRVFSQRWLVTAAAVFLTYNFTSLAYAFFVLDMEESVRLFARLLNLASMGLTA